jgi:ATP-dependent DNA helicase RecG
MAPTEILEIQHYNNMKELFRGTGVVVELLTGSTTKKEKNVIYKELKDGTIDIIVGTHALIQEEVEYHNLGLVVTDEQHRFGVNQRLKLISKYKDVDSLFFSATPIPRTLGLTFLKNLDISSIKAMPSGRKKVITKIVSLNRMGSLYISINNHLNRNERAYVVVPLIEGNEELDYIDIFECEKMFKNRFPDINIAILHGKMAPQEKNQILDRFKSGDIKILISTTVIEVGINVPEATMMIIMNPERFGLSTLHQLRGRVGRGELDSYCMLVTKDEENERLKALTTISDGFEIAEIDFKMRGPGNYLGEEQSGYQSFKYINYDTDLRILECARDDSTRLIADYINGKLKSKKYDEIVSGCEIDKIK